MLGWAPDGTLIDCVVDSPGSANDFATSAMIFQHVEEGMLHGGVYCGDKAFASARTNASIVATEEWMPEGMPALSAKQMKEFEVWRKKIRQGAEWGMGTWQRHWRVLTSILPADDAKRGRILRLCLRLTNLCARRMSGNNQIKTVYAEYYAQACEEAEELEAEEGEDVWEVLDTTQG